MHDNQHDVQELTTDQATVYEIAAALAVDDRPATVDAVAEMADMPRELVQECLDTLAEAGWLVPREGSYALGRHDWGLEY
ncbi:hypothetical protein J5X84_01125 [Streptosporangiaceae bacterium NEAU-GS5]|nr:hypothetical protein [Streptosporangiaceae bacterium NEAU-GS5]